MNGLSENSKFYKGYRPMIGWIVAIGIFLLFPMQIIIIYINAIFNLGIQLPHDILREVNTPLISLAVGIMSIRTIEKINKG
jgi:hypothetical protein